jgi:hypothetical protein
MDAVTPPDDVRARYERFAREEAPGRSALYETWARLVCDVPAVAAVLARIRDTHRQPPLVFAVSRLLGAPERPATAWASWVVGHADRLVAECEARSIQTNEPLRCAALLPALALIPGPLALLEVGASAGLCLYPDRYSYRYRMPDRTVAAIDPATGPSPVTLTSAWDGGAPPTAVPEVVWRAGIDLAPLDPADAADRAWLEGLVWPGEKGRRERVAAAADIAAADPALLVRGDAAAPGAIAALAASAPADATLVVTTPGVLAHVPHAGRRAVIDAARAAGRWVTLDAPSLHDGWVGPPFANGEWPRGRFALALDGEILAAVDPLGASVEWRR